MPKSRNHPFYCFKTNQRKSAWATPEYLDDKDWAYLKSIIPVIEAGNAQALSGIFFGAAEQALRACDFFDRMIGWPEGHNYCFHLLYLEKIGVAMLQRYLPKLKKAVKKHSP